MFCLPQLTYVLFTDTIYKNCIRIRWDYLIYYFQHGRKSTCNTFSRATCLFGYLSQLTIAYMLHGRWTCCWQMQPDKFCHMVIFATSITCMHKRSLHVCYVLLIALFSIFSLYLFHIFLFSSFIFFPFLFPHLLYLFIIILSSIIF